MRSVITHEKNGYISPIGDSFTMAQQIAFLAKNPDVLTAAGNAAFANAHQYSVDSYLKTFFSLLDQVSSTIPPYSDDKERFYRKTHKLNVLAFRFRRKCRHLSKMFFGA